MSESTSPADRMRAVGLFDRHATLAGLLRDVAAFLDTHGIAEPLAFSQHFDADLGWQATLELSPEAFVSILDGYPMPIELHHEDDPEQGAVVRMRTTLRAGTLETRWPLAAMAGAVVDGMLTIQRPEALETGPSTPSGPRVTTILR